ncbi:hypothetical protein GOV04_05635 [Candidatus Woesearchaeota archaeon]|nr:hypothetical protein [Candidatus Woesearchaeota archaeon]
MNKKRIKPQVILSIAVFILLVSGLFLFKPTITGLITFDDYKTIKLNQTFTSSKTIDLDLENIESLTISGSVLGAGSAKIYLEYDSKSLLVYDNSQSKALDSITGLSIINTTTANETIVLEIVENITIENETIEQPANKTTLEENITETIIELNTTVEQNKTTALIPAPIITTFDSVCEQTCILVHTTKDYKLKIIVDNANLTITSVNYKETTPIIEVQKGELINDKTIQEKVEINKPVKWTRTLEYDNTVDDITVDIPKKATNITAYNIVANKKQKIENSKVKTKARQTTIREQTKQIEIEYYTEAPTKKEEKISNHKKRITISSDVHYENIQVYTTIRETRKGAAKLYWLVNNTKQLVNDATYIDTNNNKLIDRIEWIVPHLSNQTYYVEINITDAEHLDSARSLITNIYDEVKEIDSVYYTIPAGDYVRAYFEKNLTNENYIDVYVINSSGATIEVYEENTDTLVGEVSIGDDGAYFIDMNHSGYQSVFDLKSVNSSITYDYVHDGPADPAEFDFDVTDTPDPVIVGSNITFNGTATSATRGYDYAMIICKGGSTISCDKGPPPTGVCSNGNWCTSSQTTSGQPATCTVTANLTMGGQNSWVAYTCDINHANGVGQPNATNSPFTVPNTIPNTPLPTINSSDGGNATNQDLNCVSTLTDNNSHVLNVTVRWYKNATLNFTLDYNNSYANGTLFNATLGSGNTSVDDEWSCAIRVYDSYNYSSWGNSTNITILIVSNTAPSITEVQPIASQNPTDASITNVNFDFNVTDTESNFNHSSAIAEFSKNGVLRSGICDNNTISATATRYNCSVAMYYYDLPGAWTINVTASDDAGLSDYNDTTSFTYNILYAFSLVQNNISFAAATVGATNLNASDDPQIINNTGNGNFATINVTAYELTNGVDTIGAGNFTINATDDAKGIALTANIIIPSANLTRNSTQDFYVWLDIPLGISNGSYSTNASTQWLVEAYN